LKLEHTIYVKLCVCIRWWMFLFCCCATVQCLSLQSFLGFVISRTRAIQMRSWTCAA